MNYFFEVVFLPSFKLLLQTYICSYESIIVVDIHTYIITYYYFLYVLGEAAIKKKMLMTVPLRGGRGKALTLRKKEEEKVGRFY